MHKGKDITMYDLAKELNVSVATVSRALKDDPAVHKKTRKRIVELANELGYQTNLFARSLRTKETKTIGFMIHELNSNFINAVLAGVERVTAREGYDLIIAHSSERLDKEVANARNLFHKRVDGLIASLAFETRNLDHFRQFSDRGIPIIFFDRVERNNDYTVVVIDNYKCGYEATKHLIDQGCKRIAHVTSSLTRNVYADRYRGYKDALFDHNLELDERLVIINDLSENAGILSAKQLIKTKPLPDGAFITNDFVAAAFMKTLTEHKIQVPKDIAVVGFNNDAIAHLIAPTLTTINYPGIEMGEVAARAIINHLKGISNINQINTVIISSKLVVRQSSQKTEQKAKSSIAV
jgi:LacI family transcriptional regulator